MYTRIEDLFNYYAHMLRRFGTIIRDTSNACPTTPSCEARLHKMLPAVSSSDSQNRWIMDPYPMEWSEKCSLSKGPSPKAENISLSQSLLRFAVVFPVRSTYLLRQNAELLKSSSC